MRLRLVAAISVVALSFQCGTDAEPVEPSPGEPSESDWGGAGGESGAPSDAGAPNEAGSGGASEGGAGPSSFIDRDLEGPLPARLSELGLYPQPKVRDRVHARAVYYEPRYPLWSNGSAKQRFMVLPRGSSVDTSSSSWVFPEGTTFFKTFSYPAGGSERAIETRVIRRRSDAYEFAVYRWNEAQNDADLLDGKASVRVSVEVDGDRFDHEIPSTLQCRSCHESQDARIIGFDALRLNHPLEGVSETQLEALHDRGVLSELPDAAPAVEAEDPTTREVLGYLQGNCAHCHNGSDGPSSAFDLRYPVALENLIGVETTSELFGGLRVSPGDPEGSALYRGIAADVEDGDAQPMPPVGVQRVDPGAVSLFYDWILALEPRSRP
jgi:hypothetical protein